MADDPSPGGQEPRSPFAELLDIRAGISKNGVASATMESRQIACSDAVCAVQTSNTCCRRQVAARPRNGYAMLCGPTRYYGF